MRIPRVATWVVVFLLLAAAQRASAEVITYAHSAELRGFQDMRFATYGEWLSPAIDPALHGSVDQFSMWLRDPGGASSVTYRTGVAALRGPIDRPETILYESDWVTLDSGSGGTREIATLLPAGAVDFDVRADLYFYISLQDYAGPAWQLLTMGKDGTAPNQGGSNGPGVGLRITGTELFFDDAQLGRLGHSVNEMPQDQDIAMTLRLGESTSNDVPEPIAGLLMLLGVIVARARSLLSQMCMGRKIIASLRPVVILIAATTLLPRPAAANLITIEPDDFAPGTNLTAATPGVLLWSASTITVSGSLLLSAVYAGHDPACDTPDSPGCTAATGSQGFVHGLFGGGPPGQGSLVQWLSERYPGDCFQAIHTGTLGSTSACRQIGLSMLLEFATPTSFVEVVGMMRPDPLEIRAYDENFQRVNVPHTFFRDPDANWPNTTFATVSMTSPAANLKFVFVGSTESPVALDRITFAQVPEPSTLLLTMIGVLGIGWRARSRTSQSDDRR